MALVLTKQIYAIIHCHFRICYDKNLNYTAAQLQSLDIFSMFSFWILCLLHFQLARYLQQQAFLTNRSLSEYHFFNTYFYKKLKEAVSYKVLNYLPAIHSCIYVHAQRLISSVSRFLTIKYNVSLIVSFKILQKGCSLTGLSIG